ncbi:transposable element Tcb1 transposase [Trichonephila clavipes]|nr:transposable element Tcb1 transposase [Trichonephila clavipes]
MSRRKQRSGFDQVSEFDRGRIVAYRDCGLSSRKIGSRVGRNQTTVMRICDRWMQDVFLEYDFWHMTVTAGSDVVQSRRPIFDDFFQHLWPYIGNNTANVVFQMVKCLWLIRIDQ